MIAVDDAFRKHLSDRLRNHKYSVVEAGDDVQARKAVQSRNIDVVLLGLEGFRHQGLELLKAIKQIRPEVEVILLNPSEALPVSIQGMKLGAFDDLWIPLDMETLLTRVEEAYQHRMKGKTGKENG